METSKGDKNLNSVMISENENSNTKNMNIGEENHHIGSNKKFLNSSSSSSSSSGESFELVGTGDSDLFTFEVVAPNGPTTTLNSDSFFITETPTPASDQTSATQSPPKQAMDRKPEVEDPEPYRIPSAVFARTKSSAQGDWSTASNESLFSIHMGNASFTKDHANWIGSSGELGLHSDPTIDYSSNQPPSVQAQITKSNDQQSPTNDESKAAETMREVIKENEVDNNPSNSKHKLATKISLRTNSFRRSDASQASIKSFAFPILTGEHKESQKQRPPQSPSQSQSPTQPSSQPQSPKISHSQSKNKAQAGTAPVPFNPGKWFSCLFCCSSK